MSLGSPSRLLADLNSIELLDFHRNGFFKIERESYSWKADFFEKVVELSKDGSDFEKKAKNSGGRTLKNEVLESERAAFIVDYLFESNLIQRCMEVVGFPLYLTNYIFIECSGKTRSLPWHRDTYHYKNSSRVGLIPYNYKLVLTIEDIDDSSPGTEILKGSHNIDFNSKVLDLIYGIVSPNKFHFKGKRGDAVIFNGHALHRRPRTKAKKSRSTIIFGLAPVGWHQAGYLENHSKVIGRYNQHLESYFSEEK